MLSTIWWCADIGMYAYDRQIAASCVHATDFCKVNCFNDKLYRIYPAMHGKDIRNESFWAQVDGAQVKRDLGRRKKQTDRVRLMTRGESFSTLGDVDKVRNILLQNPDTLFWIPTRAWRSPIIRLAINSKVRSLPNARVMASMDPTNSVEDWEALALDGWSTMAFGENKATVTPQGKKLFKCPKTFGHIKGACGGADGKPACKNGCFADRQVNVLLKQH